jgi:ketosteroid isomerase-like protein
MTTAVEVFNKMTEATMESSDPKALIGLCADDVVFEFPFAPPGRPSRVEGKPALIEYLKALAGHVRLEGVTRLEVHETVKPDVAIIEMTMTGTVAATRAPFEQSYISVLTVRNGLIAQYRDYWNPLNSPSWSAQ